LLEALSAAPDFGERRRVRAPVFGERRAVVNQEQRRGVVDGDVAQERGELGRQQPACERPVALEILIEQRRIHDEYRPALVGKADEVGHAGPVRGGEDAQQLGMIGERRRPGTGHQRAAVRPDDRDVRIAVRAERVRVVEQNSRTARAAERRDLQRGSRHLPHLFDPREKVGVALGGGGPGRGIDPLADLRGDRRASAEVSRKGHCDGGEQHNGAHHRGEAERQALHGR
jgi:hypothetical protein